MRYICFTGRWLRNQSVQPAQMEEQVHKGSRVQKKGKRNFAILKKTVLKLARDFAWNTSYNINIIKSYNVFLNCNFFMIKLFILII